jgi:putative DNA primase/helicase
MDMNCKAAAEGSTAASQNTDTIGQAAIDLLLAQEERWHSGENIESLDQAIKRLGALSSLEYDQVRDDEARRLCVRLSTLDEEVYSVRKKSSAGKERNIFPEDDLWPTLVDGEDLFDELVKTFTRYSVLPKGSAEALALWTLLTYCYDYFRILPILLISSPEKRCGKSTTMGTLTSLCYRVISASNITPAVLFRSVEAYKPTLLIDEADTFLGQNEELRGVINSGHLKSSAHVLRCEGDDHKPVPFSTWCPKALAMIGSPPDTIFDRSVVVPLRRKLKDESVERYDHNCDLFFEELRRKVLRFISDNEHAIRTTEAPRLINVNDRLADNWQPLLTIAAVIGRTCLDRAMAAAEFLIDQSSDDATPSAQLLTDIRDIFTGDRITSDELVKLLIEREDRPWCEWKHGKSLTKNGLSKLLKPFDIKPKPIRFVDKVARGYLLADFEDAFSRYLPDQNDTPLQPSNNRCLPQFESVTDVTDVTFQEECNRLKLLSCNDVTFQPDDQEREPSVRCMGEDDFLFPEAEQGELL